MDIYGFDVSVHYFMQIFVNISYIWIRNISVIFRINADYKYWLYMNFKDEKNISQHIVERVARKIEYIWIMYTAAIFHINIVKY